MTELLRQQISAFIDDALPAPEGEVLLRRLDADDELCGTYACYHLIGASLRREPDASVLAARVRDALRSEQPAAAPESPLRPASRWRSVLKPVAAVAVVASVAVVAIAFVQGVQGGRDATPAQIAHTLDDPGAREPVTYTTPAASVRPSIYIGNADLARKALRHSSYAMSPNPSIMNYRIVGMGRHDAARPDAAPVPADTAAGSSGNTHAEEPGAR
jgi:hypothetical protein